jgi:hypothetical protein
LNYRDCKEASNEIKTINVFGIDGCIGDTNVGGCADL